MGRISTIPRRSVCAAFLAYIAIATVGCTDGKPDVMESKAYLSPDSHWSAVSERVDNGMGFGLGRLYEEVHLLPSERRIEAHGDESPSVIFYIESEQTEADRPKIEWLDGRHIRIEYSALHRPYKALTSFQGFTIQYKTHPFEAKESAQSQH